MTCKPALAVCAWLALAHAAAPTADLSPRPEAPGQGHRELRGEAALVRAYDFILDARFDQVDAELRRACGEAPGSPSPESTPRPLRAGSAAAPAEACDVLEATALWWRIQLDPESRALDAAFNAAVERAIRTSEAWTDRAPLDPEAWFYLGGAYAARVQWRVLRQEKLAAARDGRRIKDALEQALELDPSLDDAYFGLGMYKYYADVAPTAARVLRFLLLLPGGDREEGLREMLRARERGRLLQGEADYQLHIIYLWYERQPGRALDLLRRLQGRFPGNPLFASQIAHVQDAYEHDITASLDTWRSLLAAAHEQRVNAASLAEVQARLGIARLLESLYQTDHAIEQLEAVAAMKPAAPYSAHALALLKLGEAHDRVGARGPATNAYRAAIAAAPREDPLDVRGQAAERLRRGPGAAATEAYRRSLNGWRRLEQNDLPSALAELRRSLELDGNDPVARYRYGRVLQALRHDEQALEQYQLAMKDSRECPPPILGNTYLEAARLRERAGRKEEAISGYRIAATLFGASAETRSAAQRALERMLK